GADGPTPLPGFDPPGDVGAGAHPGPGAALPVAAEAAARPGDDHPQMPGKGSGAALPDRSGPGGGPAPVPGRPAGGGPAGQPPRAGREVGAAAAGPGGGLPVPLL